MIYSLHFTICVHPQNYLFQHICPRVEMVFYCDFSCYNTIKPQNTSVLSNKLPIHSGWPFSSLNKAINIFRIMTDIKQTLHRSIAKGIWIKACWKQQKYPMDVMCVIIITWKIRNKIPQFSPNEEQLTKTAYAETMCREQIGVCSVCLTNIVYSTKLVSSELHKGT